MHAIRQKCRPKHQVLVLKCYPRTTKGAVDVKPNSSELSYLLYYATTRRTKIQKVGAFLEKKTASDVWRARIGNVQVTLQILAALIEKAPRDLPLYSHYVLKILGLILRSDDITMVEASIPTFEAFCEHHDAASLSADQEYLRQYQETVKLYASFASTGPKSLKATPSAPVAMRWRVAGLQALRSVASSETLATVAGRQLDIIMPALLENVDSNTPDYLEILYRRAEMQEKTDEKVSRRRMSTSTVKTADNSNDPNALVLSATTADADKLAEEDIGILALQCLKKIFVVNNRSQIRGATLATIRFMGVSILSGRESSTVSINETLEQHKAWCTSILLMIARWTPVQDRYVILVTAMETLVNASLAEGNLAQQLVLSDSVGCLLRSDVNLIGLSVMDVLLGLIQHILRVLQLENTNAHLPQAESLSDEKPANDFPPSPSSKGAENNGLVTSASGQRQELVSQLQQCVADLATHVYYTDQISDMIAAILLRLRPSHPSPIGSTAAAIEDSAIANEALLSSGNLSEDPRTDGFFTFDTAKLVALNAIKGIISVATRRGKLTGSASLGRNRVGLQVWEGTQWLLRDGNGKVRKAYVDALLTWLDKEVVKSDLVVLEDKPTYQSLNTKLARNAGDDSGVNLAKRAASNASQLEKTSRATRTTFLQLLHLAIYENAHQLTHSDSDILLLHLLLATLVEKLGVNAVKSGLPMIFRLQEDIQDVGTMDKVRIGSLCHAYFWTLCRKFDFETSDVGREITNEIQRRRSKGFWMEKIHVPPIPLGEIGIPGQLSPSEPLPMDLEYESLIPFDDRIAMVNLISVGYSDSLASPPNSPPTTPGRSFAHPILNNIHVDPSTTDRNLPVAVKEQMLSEWSKENVIAGAQESSKTASLNGSRTTGTGQARNFMAVNSNVATSGKDSGSPSPPMGRYKIRSRPSSQALGIGGVGGGIPAHTKLRKSGGPNDSATPASESEQVQVARVDHLKRVLTGQAPPSRGFSAYSNSSSESMVSYDGTELSFDNRGISMADHVNRSPSTVVRSKSRDLCAGDRPQTLHPNLVGPVSEAVVPEINEDPEYNDEIPPVPPLPASLNIPGKFLAESSSEKVQDAEAALQDLAAPTTEQRAQTMPSRGLRSRGGQSMSPSISGSWRPEIEPEVDLQLLLKGIDTSGHVSQSLMTKPPY